MALKYNATDEGPFGAFTAAVRTGSHWFTRSKALTVIANTMFDCHMSIKHHGMSKYNASANQTHIDESRSDMANDC